MEKQYIDYKYVLEETAESMEKSIDNLSKVINSQTTLCEIVENSEKKEEMKEFTQGLRLQIAEYNKQKKILDYRLPLLKEVIKYYKDPEFGYAITLLLEAFGVANKEGKSVEERIENKEDVIHVN